MQRPLFQTPVALVNDENAKQSNNGIKKSKESLVPINAFTAETRPHTPHHSEKSLLLETVHNRYCADCNHRGAKSSGGETRTRWIA
jgi:hypothetical protein